MSDDVTSIGDRAFANCSGLTNITIPRSVTNIYANSLTPIYYGDGAFYNCSGLSSIAVDNGNTTYRSENDCLIRMADNMLILGCKNSMIPNYVVNICAYAFSGCSGLISITIPDNMNSIGEYAFSGCSSLTSLKIPDSVTNIMSGAFSGCSGLLSVTLPFIGWSRVSASSSALFGYIFGTDVYVGGTSTKQYYGSYSSDYTNYYLPTALRAVTITDASTLQYGAFYGCNLLTNIIISNSLTSIGENAFRGCNSLTSITLPFVGASRTATTYSSVLGYIFGYTTSSSSTPPSGTTYQYLTSSVVNSVTTYTYYHYYIPSALKVVIITSGNSLGIHAFYNCSGLTSITIPDSVTSIGSSAFWYCTNLMSITIPSKVANIDINAFYGWSSNQTIYIQGFSSAPSGWVNNWNAGCSANIVWNA